MLVVCLVTMADTTCTVSGIGKWFKTHKGPDAVIVLIFFFSGLILNAHQIKSGMVDIKGFIIAFFIIFIAAPASAAFFGATSINTGIKIGIFLVAVMPSTLSSGVVMTGASGGNMAHALFITLFANSIAVFTIPVALSLLLSSAGGSAVISIEKVAIMLKLATLVLLPLFCGLTLRFYAQSTVKKFSAKLQIINQLLVLGIVWMAFSQAREIIMESGKSVGIIFLLVFIFHGILLAIAWFLTRVFMVGKGRRESIIFMGCQKTLPLSIILQVSLFPQYGLALVVCVMHHMVHLLMDGYLVGKLKQ